MKATLDDCAIKLSAIVSGYAQNVQIEVMAKLDETADKILDYIKSHAPRGNSNNHLADSFIKTKFGSGVNTTIYISSKTKSNIVHLVELGFRHRGGKYVIARPFLRPAYETFTPIMLEDIRRIINDAS